MAQAFVDKHQAQIGLERSLIKSTITEILESSIQEHRLRSKTVDELDQLFEIYANELCSVLGQTIRSQCLAIGYRVVVQVVLTAFKDQGIDVSQKCAWHSALDNYIQVSAGGKNALILVQTYFVKESQTGGKLSNPAETHLNSSEESSDSSSSDNSSSSSSSTSSSGSDSNTSSSDNSSSESSDSSSESDSSSDEEE
ncbi:uncharacterized protein LOC131889672 [Tigriopus californicus]|uniref:uncharacterized protein LOC131889672 n=1 Tax=Tigriopus californicus TaxID=6832 RepID=UPI0027DA9ED0|nr:uncharacterized protein LOC131889672 [Tigriopus californicus]